MKKLVGYLFIVAWVVFALIFVIPDAWQDIFRSEAEINHLGGYDDPFWLNTIEFSIQFFLAIIAPILLVSLFSRKKSIVQ